MNRLLIQNGTLIHAWGQQRADILIQGETIHEIASWIQPPAVCEIIEARGKLIFPGVIDPHTHMGIPIKSGSSADSFASGTRSALHGGVTTILDFTVLEADQSLQTSLIRRRSLAEASLCDVGLHINISRFDDGLLAEIPHLIAAGFNSFKTFTTYKEAGMMLSYGQIEKVAEVIARGKGVLMVHAEDDDIISKAAHPHLEAHASHPRFHGLSRPAEAEAVAVQRLGEISVRTGCHIYIVHLNTARGLEIAASFPTLKVETCPHYLLLDDSAYERPDGRMFVASPPLRSLADQAALWAGLEGGQVHTLGSDHCPFRLKDKPAGQLFQDIPNGMGGVETLFPTLLAQFLERKLSLSLLAGLCSANPAGIFGLDQVKGSLKPGMDADLLLIDPSSDRFTWEDQLDTVVNWNAYAGLPAVFPEKVWRRGEKVVDHYQVVKPTIGKLLRAVSVDPFSDSALLTR